MSGENNDEMCDGGGVDIQWGLAVVCWCVRRRGWALPGGGFTRNKTYAAKNARAMSVLIGDSDVSVARKSYAAV